jgi:hypothetical protein
MLRQLPRQMVVVLFELHAVACRLISLLDLTSSISSVVLVLLIARGNCLSVVELLLFTFEMCARRLLMHPRCSEEFENHNLHTVNTKDSKNCCP